MPRAFSPRIPRARPGACWPRRSSARQTPDSTSARTAAPGQSRRAALGHMDHRFDDPARYAKEFDDPARDAWQMPSRVIAALALQPGHKVADIGAGTGYFSMRLAASPAAPDGVRGGPRAVDGGAPHRARRRREAAPTSWPCRPRPTAPTCPKPVDVVLVVDTYHHIPNRPAYFAGVRAKLRPGGRLAIVDFRKGAPGGGPPEAFRFTPEQISAGTGGGGLRARRAARLPAAATVPGVSRQVGATFRDTLRVHATSPRHEATQEPRAGGDNSTPPYARLWRRSGSRSDAHDEAKRLRAGARTLPNIHCLGTRAVQAAGSCGRLAPVDLQAGNAPTSSCSG